MNSITSINSDWFSIVFYSVAMLQVVSTAMIVPLMLSKHYQRRFAHMNSEFVENGNAKKWLSAYQAAAALVAVSLLFVIVRAFQTQSELFGWDNQAGLTVMFVFAYLPAIILVSMERRFDFPKSTIRNASLIRQSWRDFIPKTAITLLLLGQVGFIGATAYYTMHPFEGFGGLFNIVGLIFLNAVMCVAVYVSMHGRHIKNIENIEKKSNARELGVKINLFIWILASFHITVSLVLAGEGLRDYSLILQSVYFQIIYVASIQILSKNR